MWVLLRLEHEHVANVENYRVVASVPLLFAAASTTPATIDVSDMRRTHSLASTLARSSSVAQADSVSAADAKAAHAALERDKRAREARMKRHMGIDDADGDVFDSDHEI